MKKYCFDPIYYNDSKILILGSFPSVESLKQGFYYSHPKNRFWQVLSIIYNDTLPITITDKKQFLKKHQIALYDVCKTCNIEASKDSTIKNVKPNNLKPILKKSNIKYIFINGQKAYQLYNKLIKEKINIKAICLPSTSPANAKFSLEKLVNEYIKLNAVYNS